MYANVIVDISVEKLDRPFQYIIPKDLEDAVVPGVRVEAPFGNRTITGYVIEVTDVAEIDVSRMKEITKLVEQSVEMESQLIALAAWMRKNYGSTMNQALKTVLPVKKKTKPVEHKWIHLAISVEEANKKLALYEAKHSTAKAKLLRALIETNSLEQRLITEKLQVATASITSLKKDGVITTETITTYRNPISHLSQKEYQIKLNEMQQEVCNRVCCDMDDDISNTYLLKGVTGSGKTEVYMEVIAHAIEKKKQAIVLIPEIALTFQTVMRFYNRFGDRVSIINSRMSDGERYDQYQRARDGDIDIIIGPRSALFAPFANLGLIIIDEEHETSYKSEQAPRYHAREVAMERAKMSGASLILGSATPSMESYYRAKNGEFVLLELKSRAKQSTLPECEIIDLREELRMGNRSILSERLQSLMEERLNNNEQIMLFLNRRGISGSLSCRSCGEVIKCPHCDVALSLHRGGRLLCHYCGYETTKPTLCPSCQSKYIGEFKAGTEKIEELVQKRFPKARILRMDYDTTRKKDDYESILSAFGNHEADILIGTQMIVKGHDFSNVTLMGILAADMSLNVSDYHGPERTFQLLTQAAGRAGRGDKPGEVIIQTYSPDHYAIQTAKEQDYEAFYKTEISYRSLMAYPPAENMLVIQMSHSNENYLMGQADAVGKMLRRAIEPKKTEIRLFGPTENSISRINDMYRRVIYLKSKDYSYLVKLKDYLDRQVNLSNDFESINIQYDFNPVSGF